MSTRETTANRRFCSWPCSGFFDGSVHRAGFQDARQSSAGKRFLSMVRIVGDSRSKACGRLFASLLTRCSLRRQARTGSHLCGVHVAEIFARVGLSGIKQASPLIRKLRVYIRTMSLHRNLLSASLRSILGLHGLLLVCQASPRSWHVHKTNLQHTSGSVGRWHRSSIASDRMPLRGSPVPPGLW